VYIWSSISGVRTEGPVGSASWSASRGQCGLKLPLLVRYRRLKFDKDFEK